MAYPNTLIFVDYPSSDPVATAEFCEAVFGWVVEPRSLRGATELWRDHYRAEFNGFNAAFEDPWSNTFVLWLKGGDDPQIPEGWTDE